MTYKPPYFLFTLVFQLSTALVCSAIAVSSSPDAKTFWPLVLAMEFFWGVVFLSASCGITRQTVLSAPYLYGYNLTAAAIHTGQVAFFYINNIDWLAVNSGTHNLTLLEKAITNPFSMILSYLILFAFHYLVVSRRKKLANND